MNIKHRRVRTNFGPDTKFEIKPAPPAPFRALQENAFERLKDELLTGHLEDVWAAEFNSHVRRAANEAAALAWVTPYPSLVFPVLFEEKIDTALARAERQKEILQRSRELLAV